MSAYEKMMEKKHMLGQTASLTADMNQRHAVHAVQAAAGAVHALHVAAVAAARPDTEPKSDEESDEETDWLKENLEQEGVQIHCCIALDVPPVLGADLEAEYEALGLHPPLKDEPHYPHLQKDDYYQQIQPVAAEHHGAPYMKDGKFQGMVVTNHYAHVESEKSQKERKRIIDRAIRAVQAKDNREALDAWRYDRKRAVPGFGKVVEPAT